MTAEGETVVAGIYVLVHAAALGRIVRDVLDNYRENPGIHPGDMFLTNDTYVGAPHQADVIVVAPIFDGDRLVAWTGSCVHQADVGGPVPGSITVGARNIYEEALPISPVKIVGSMLGVWFLADSLGNKVAGFAAGFISTAPLPQLFGAVAGVCLGASLIAFLLIKPVRGLMGGVH